jgi:hypothetical protein
VEGVETLEIAHNRLSTNLEWLDPERSLSDNISEVILAPGSMFIAEPAFLLYDEVRDPRTYLAILQAIGAGHHTLSDIANAALVGRTHLAAYLARLQELRLIERRLPVTVPPASGGAPGRGDITSAMPTSAFTSALSLPTWTS